MITRRLALLGWLSASGLALAQTDDRAAQIAARYEAILATNPAEEIALDRLWKNATTRGETAALIERHRAGNAIIYGRLLQLGGRLDEAEAAFRTAAGREPASPLPPFELGELATARSKPGEAAAFYETALGKLPPGDRREGDWLLKLGEARLAAGHAPEAAEAWEKLVARRPDDAALHRRLIETYEAHGMSDRAIAHLDYLQAHAEPAERALALRDLARLYEAKGDFEPARDALQNGLALTARDNWLHVEMQASLIRLYQRAGRAAELQAQWEAEAAKSPKDLDVFQRLESLARDQGDPVGETRWLEKITALAPSDRESARRLARLLADAGERERAAAIYDGLLKIRPTDQELILARAELDVQMNRDQAAVDRLNSLGDNAAALDFFLRHRLDAAAERRLRADVSAKPAAEEPPVALAKFLFSRRRPADAHAVLDGLIAAAPDQPARIERFGRAADCYRQAGQSNDALQCLRQAAQLAPDQPAAIQAVADALAARGDTAAAAAAYQHAYDLTPAGPDRVEIDHRLFAALNAAAPPSPPPPPPERGEAFFGRPRRRATEWPGLGMRRGRGVTPAVTEQLGRLADSARAQPSAERFLRLARWQSWAHAEREAATSATHAAELEPSSVEARELLFELATQAGDKEAAARRLGELVTLDPARKPHWLKALADLKIEDGDIDHALGVYQELARLNPTSVDALSDLAIAQQRADRWYDAQAAWERAYALPAATPQQRADLRRPLLATLERLEEFPRATDLLQSAIDAAPTVGERLDLFHQLTEFSARHHLTEDLAARCEQRLARQPQDYFNLVALSEIRRAQGRGQQAYDLLDRALYSSPDRAETLRSLVDLAESLGNTEAAIAQQRRLAALNAADSSDAAERLAQLESAAGDDPAASKTWDAIVARFPRDAAVLGRAGDYFEANDEPDRARSVLRRLAALDPADLKRIYRLGQLDLAAGDILAARASFSAVLAGSDSEKPGEPPQPPTPRGTLKPEPRFLRLGAIRELAQTLPAAERAAWIARWQTAAGAGARNEPLWAFFYSGAKSDTAALLARWVAEQPDDDATAQLFIRTSLRIGDSAAVARWTWSADPGSERGDQMLTGLAQFLIDGGQPDGGLLAALFPPKSPRDLRWKAAGVVFAGRQRYADAIALGNQVCREVSVNRSNYAIGVAGWDLLLGRIADARDILRQAIDLGGADSLEATSDQYFTALHEYWTLLPSAERDSFTQDMLRRGGGPAQIALTRALLHALGGNEKAAESALDDLAALRILGGEPGAGSSDVRRWSYLLANGAQLATWNLDAAAIHLWRRALSEATSFQRQDPECRSVLSEIQAQLAGAEIQQAATPAEAAGLLDDYLRTHPDPVMARALSTLLMAASKPSLAARVEEYLVHAEHADPEHVRELLDAYTAAGDTAGLQIALRQLLDESGRLGDRPAGLQPADLAVRLAGALERDGDPDGARGVLAHQLAANPRALPVGLALAQMDGRAKRVDDGFAVLRQLLPFDAGMRARLRLAGLEANRGNDAEAKKLLAEGASQKDDAGHVEAASRLVALDLAGGDRAGALALAIDPAVALAAAIGQEKDPAAARELFGLAFHRGTDPAVRFAAQRGLLSLSDAASLPRASQRLRRLAGTDDALLTRSEEAQFQRARALGLDAWLEGELKTDWAQGYGRASAGGRLIDLYLSTGRTKLLPGIVQALLANAAAWEPAARAIADALVNGGQAELALPLLERLTQRLPENESDALARVRALWKAGRIAQADAAAEALSLTETVHEHVNERLAQLFVDLGNDARALARFRRIGPMAPAEVHLAMARIEMKTGDRATARLDLREAYRRSETADLTPLLEWLMAGGGGQTRLPGGDFPLSVRRRGELATLLFDRLSAGGKLAEARAMAMAHPELLAAAPELAGRLRAGATAEERPAIVTVLESALAQSDPPAPRLVRELAGVYVERAADDPAGAPAFLARAHQLCP